MPSNGQAENEPGHDRLTFASISGPHRRTDTGAEMAAAVAASEEDLLRLERLARLGTLSAGLAHEIKNALVAVATFIDLLLENNRDAQLADTVRHELSRIDSIAAKMLHLASPGTTNFSEVHLHNILERALRLVQHQLQAKSISLERSYGASPDVINGDELQLEQVFLNLLLNALDAMGQTGELVIATELVRPEKEVSGAAALNKQSYLRVVVKDNGAGISAENLQRLFEPFFSTKAGGTGLGLAITRDIIQRHGGQIEVESRPNEGAAFSILLPALISRPLEEARAA